VNRPWLQRGIRLLHLDAPLLALLAVLLGTGLFVLYSATGSDPAMLWRQASRIGIALGVMVVAANLPPRLIRLWSPPFYLTALALLVLVLVAGEGRGAQRWLDFGLFRFQPSEMMKLGLPMMLAWLLHGHHLPPRFWRVMFALLLIAAPVALTGIQPDLGTAVLIAAAGGFVLFLSGIRWRYLLAGGGLLAAAMPVLWWAMKDYQRLRIHTFLDPSSDPLGRGWNIIQSKIAVGSGGLWGKGWLGGTQSHLEFLPESHTDFILAVFAEEFGFTGVVLLLALYLAIALRALYLAQAAGDTYSRLLGGSIALIFFVYVLVNTAMVAGLLPVVGVPLPLVSYGGTSAMTLLGGFGLLMALYSHRRIWAKS